MKKTVKAESDFKLKAGLTETVEKLAKAKNIDKQRAAFNEVSTQMWKLVESTGKLNEPVYYQYCPMKKAYWLSSEKTVENPYYGAAMPTCGKTVDSLE